MRNRILKVCEACIFGIAYAILASLCGLIVYAIGFAFWQLGLQLIG